MIIQCPSCGTQYQINTSVQAQPMKSSRCMMCGTDIPPPSPPTAPPLPEFPPPKRHFKRDPLFLRASLRLHLTGQEIHGTTQDVSAGGSYLQTHNAPEDERIPIGVTGVFTVILRESIPPVTCEWVGEVVRYDREGVGVRFIYEEEIHPVNVRSPSINPAFSPPPPRSLVYVRRSNGSLEGEWEVLPPRAKIPPTIAAVLRERKQTDLCVVCRKKTPAGESFKIYTLKELKSIQEEAARDLKSVSSPSGGIDPSQTRLF